MGIHRVFTGMKSMIPLLAAALMPLAVAAQQDPVQRLGEVLPPELAAQVAARVEAARSGGLPAQSVANLALEGVAKGRSSEEVLGAIDALVSDMGRAREAILAAGRQPAAGEVEAATTAIRMGVEGSAVSELARSGPSGRSLAIPLLVMGGLTQRGLPSDEALEAVRERLAARAPDSELLSTFGLPGRGRGFGPDGAGPDVGGGRAGQQVPPGPPENAGSRGRGRGGPPTN